MISDTVNGLIISNLLFTDNVLVFYEENLTILGIFHIFCMSEAISILKVELAKFELLPIGNNKIIESLESVL